MKEKRLDKWKRIKICILAIIALALYMPTVKAETSQAEEYMNTTMANPESITEFVKADGSTYYIETPTTETINRLKNADTLYGRYQFNYTGSAMLCVNPNGGEALMNYYNEQYYSKLSTMEGYEWLADYENSDEYYKNFGLDTRYIKGNSSAGKLVQENEQSKIYKAYLVVTTVTKRNDVRHLLKEMPITLIGPNAKYIKTKMEYVYVNSLDYKRRSMGYMDVTEFVQDQGYGWYYCCNIPYCCDDNRNWDQFANWRLYIIEENPDLGIRALKLDIGILESDDEHIATMSILLDDMTTKLGDEQVTGQLLFSIDGGDIGKGISYNKIYLKETKNNKTSTKYIDFSVPEGAEKIIDEKGKERTIVYRVNESRLVELMTRNNVPITTLRKFGDIFENNLYYRAFKIGEKYVLGAPRMDGDTELMDIEKFKSTTGKELIENGSNKFNVVFDVGGDFQLTASVLRVSIRPRSTEIQCKNRNNSRRNL